MEVIAKQLSLLMLLQLDFSPRAEDITKVRDIWVYAFTRAIGSPNEEYDRKRITEAFLGSMHLLKKWPAPAEIIERMASRRPVPQIDNNPPPASPERVREFMSILNDRLDGVITTEELEHQSDLLAKKYAPAPPDFKMAAAGRDD